MAEQIYEYRFDCCNCGWFFIEKIPFEMTTEKYLKKNPHKLVCPNCGCKIR